MLAQPPSAPVCLTIAKEVADPDLQPNTHCMFMWLTRAALALCCLQLLQTTFGVDTSVGSGPRTATFELLSHLMGLPSSAGDAHHGAPEARNELIAMVLKYVQQLHDEVWCVKVCVVDWL